MDGYRLFIAGPLDDNGPSNDPISEEYCNLRLINDRSRKESSKWSWIRYRERPIGHVINGELLISRRERQLTNPSRHRAKVGTSTFSDHGHDQSITVEINRDAQVDVVVDNELIFFN